MTQDDPVALRSARLFRAFARYLRWRMGREFNAVRMSRAGRPDPSTTGRPLIVYSNHPSWWDPAVYILLSDMLFPARAAFGPMDQVAFAQYGIFRRLGVFGIALDRPGGKRRLLEIARRVFEVGDGMLWITAEGRFVDPHLRPIVLRSGLAHLAQEIPDAIFMPLALSYQFWNESRPEVFVRFGAPLVRPAGNSVAETTETLTQALQIEMDALAAETATRDDRHFELLVSGRAGAGAIYDQWRRFRSVLRGQAFDPTHRAAVAPTTLRSRRPSKP